MSQRPQYRPHAVGRRRFFAGGAAAGITVLGGAARAQAEPVRIGAVLPFSGGLELFGEQARIGIDLAAAEINAQGGILGRPVEIHFQDMRTDPKAAAEKARMLVLREEVIAVCGPITSSARNAMIPHMMRERTPLLYATNYEGADEDGGGCGRYLFFFNTVPNQDTAPLIPYLKEVGLGDRYYMFGANYVWPRNVFKSAKAMIRKMGGRELGEEYTAFGVKDYAPVIERIERAQPEILLFALPGADGIAFIKQAHAAGLTRRLTVAFLGFSETYLEDLGAEAGDGMYVGVPFVSTSDEPGATNFVARVRAAHGPRVGVSHYVFSHYNAIVALKEGLERAGEVSREAAVDGMSGLDFAVPTGTAGLNARDHHISLNMYIARTEQGRLRVVEALGRCDPISGCA